MQIVISIDVEEEGLFCGSYPRRPPGVRNVAHLSRIGFISRDLGLPLTLLPTYPVLRDPACRDILLAWQEESGAEIGAHLHPWNTPPFDPAPRIEPVASGHIPRDLLGAKIGSLSEAVQTSLGIMPRAFRMGRFDFSPELPDLLSERGFLVDCSMVPLRRIPRGPDHFLTPPDPFPLDRGDGNTLILEAPLTVVPLWERAGRDAYRLARWMPQPKADRVLTAFRHIAALGIQPAWFPLASMKVAALLHRKRGGRVLHMFLHSSELAPGATPEFRDESAVRGLVEKVRAFLHWLLSAIPVRGATLSQLHEQRGSERA